MANYKFLLIIKYMKLAMTGIPFSFFSLSLLHWPVYLLLFMFYLASDKEMRKREKESTVSSFTAFGLALRAKDMTVDQELTFSFISLI